MGNVIHKCNEIHCIKSINECVQTHFHYCKHMIWLTESTNSGATMMAFLLVLLYVFSFPDFHNIYYLCQIGRGNFAHFHPCPFVGWLLYQIQYCNVYTIAFIPTCCLVEGNYYFWLFCSVFCLWWWKKFEGVFQALLENVLVSNIWLEQFVEIPFPSQFSDVSQKWHCT